MSNAFKAPAVKLDRYFGKCTTKGCTTRKVHEGKPFIGRDVIFYNGHNGPALAEAGYFCTEHRACLTFTQLVGRVVPDRDCNGERAAEAQRRRDCLECDDNGLIDLGNGMSRCTHDQEAIHA